MMKKWILILGLAIGLLFLADAIYAWYSRNYVNSHEAVVLVNQNMLADEVDAFFSLPEGTYEAKKHHISYVIQRENSSALQPYITLPTRFFTGPGDLYDCAIAYEEVRGYHFYDYEMGNRTIMVRLISSDEGGSRKKEIARKYLEVVFEMGKINVIDVYVNGASNRCN